MQHGQGYPDPAEAGQRARELLAQGRSAEAVDLLKAATAGNPENAGAWNDLGVACAMSGRVEEALKALRQARSLDKTSSVYVLNLAQALAGLNRPDEAVRELEAALPAIGEAGRPKLEAELERYRRLVPPAGPRRPEFATLTEALNHLPGPDPALPLPQVAAADLETLKDVRILQAPSELIGNIDRLTTYLRRLGLKAVGLNYGHNTWADFRCDLNINIHSLSPQTAQERILGLFQEGLKLFDLFHFHYARSFLPNLSDLPILQKEGKKILFSFYGSDMSSMEVTFYNQARFLGHNPPKPYHMTRTMLYTHNMINTYADVIYSPIGTPRGIYNFGALDSHRWSLAEKERILSEVGRVNDPNKLYLLHAPSNGLFKGTHMIMERLEECKKRGLPIELISITKTPLNEARRIYVQADCAVDQVGAGTFGLFGREMMCWEIPVVSYQNRLFERIRPGAPIINVTRENFVDRIAHLVDMKKRGELAELGRRSRRWVLDNCDVTTVGIPPYVSVYASLMRGEKIKQYINNKWFMEAQAMQSGQKSDFYRYMFTNKVFEQIGADPPEYDKTLYN